jgi:hypothetical protein
MIFSQSFIVPSSGGLCPPVFYLKPVTLRVQHLRTGSPRSRITRLPARARGLNRNVRAHTKDTRNDGVDFV